MNKLCFASDNWAPAHPAILSALQEANSGVAAPYGNDPWTEKAAKLIQAAFQREAKVYFVPSGTGANIFALRLACRPYESVLCTDISHICYHESGAAEALAGCKLLTIPHQQGKVKPELLLKAIQHERAFGLHSTSPRVLSIAQPTEVGTVYTLAELEKLSLICQEEKILLHIDGSRFYNAALALGVSLAEMIASVNVDLLSLGGTKNGLIGAEALLIFNPDLEKGSGHLHKQSLQLMSKMRYLAAQYIPFFEDKLWWTLASQANQSAEMLAESLRGIPQLLLSYPVETNQLFFTASQPCYVKILEQIACHPWDRERHEIRFITSWNTTREEIEQARDILVAL